MSNNNINIDTNTYKSNKIYINKYPEFSGDLNKIKEASKEFEKIFIKYLVDNMYKPVEIFNEDNGYENLIWQDFFNDEIASKISENFNLGISDAIYKQIASQYLSKDIFDEESNNSNIDNNIKVINNFK